MGKKHSGSRHERARPLDDQYARHGPESASAASISNIRWSVLIGLLLVVVTLAAYWQVLDCGFLDGFDDHEYVVHNPLLTHGIGLNTLEATFTTFRAANWHPLTWISHMIDYRLYKLDPVGHHLTNLLFHIVNALLVFVVLKRMTGSVCKSGFVAALFALHPLHVESVAWISERKDVLSTFFWLLTMLAYAAYARRPGKARYALIIVAFALGLMSKPMVVTLPFVLLLLDYWPLDRMSLRWKLIWEKAPLFALSIASCVVTLIAQRSGGAVAGLDALPVGLRASNAAVSYVAYIAKMIWPSGLSVFYPYPLRSLQVWEGVGAALLLAAATILALRIGRKYRYVAVGWLWYVITLVPVIGLVQVGAQAMADRYTYITLTGLFVIIAWGVPDLLSERAPARSRRAADSSATERRRTQLAICAVAVTAVLAVCTWHRVEPWKDTNALFRHALAINPNNHLAYGALGKELNDQGEYEEAADYLSRAIGLHPSDATAHVNLGTAFIKLGRVDEAFDHLRKALSLGLDVPEIHHNLAFGYFRMRKLDLAREECSIALQLDPEFAPSHNLMGAISGEEGNLDEAISHWKLAMELDPNSPSPHSNLALAYFRMGDYEAAWKEIHLLQKKGGSPDPGLFKQLSMRAPDPGE